MTTEATRALRIAHQEARKARREFIAPRHVSLGAPEVDPILLRTFTGQLGSIRGSIAAEAFQEPEHGQIQLSEAAKDGDSTAADTFLKNGITLTRVRELLRSLNV